MPEDQEAQHWFVLLNERRYGPYTLPALVKGVEKGVIGRSAGVWRPGWEQWRDAREIPELFAPEPDAVEETGVTEETEAAEETEQTAEAPATSPPEEALDGTQAREHAESAATLAVEDRAETDDHFNIEPSATAAVPASIAPEPAVADQVPAKSEAKETGGPREVRESFRRNRFRDGPDLFGRGFARSDPVRLEPVKSDPAKPDRARPEVGKRDLAKLDFGTTTRRDGAARDAGSRDLLARAIPSELGAPDMRLRNPPLTDAALRVRLNTMLASADLAAPRNESAEEPAADDGQAYAEKAGGPAPDSVATKPLIAIERVSEVSSGARSRKADIKPDIAAEREGPKFAAGAPPIPAPVPAPQPKSARRGGSFWPVILSAVATLVVVSAVAWAASALGIMRVEFLPKQGGKAAAALQSLPGASSAVRAHATLDGLPDIAGNMPAVIALKMADPDAYGKFVKRFTAVYRNNEADDVILTQARTALRKSVKHMLANATNESLLEVTEVNLAYMRGLSAGNAGSCVALSDESKGAVLDANLARDFPPLFEREMAVLERVIGNAGAKQTAPTEAEVRPYLEAVFAGLKKKPVQMQLLGRDKLTEAEYAPYCDLVIAFYEGVRALPFGDAVKLLRNLYAAAAEPDKT
jgi:GYF domain 2